MVQRERDKGEEGTVRPQSHEREAVAKLGVY
jgi:hypothetical protein